MGWPREDGKGHHGHGSEVSWPVRAQRQDPSQMKLRGMGGGESPKTIQSNLPRYIDGPPIAQHGHVSARCHQRSYPGCAARSVSSKSSTVTHSSHVRVSWALSRAGRHRQGTCTPPSTYRCPAIHTYIQQPTLRRTGASFPHTWEPPPPGSTHLSTPHPLFSFSSTSLPLLCPPPQFPLLPPFSSTIPRIRRYFDNFRHEPRHRSSTLGFRSLSSISLPTSLCRLLSRSSTPTIV